MGYIFTAALDGPHAAPTGRRAAHRARPALEHPAGVPSSESTRVRLNRSARVRRESRK
ncbi:hypothetical protein NONO_c00660 [Nocardia nova SH22a]|uniref:Uncharacterized protein n=1 Tax=Nocardia nova SH22a TaxID=1415166 RepID=W5TCF6_9NOCA|nr:hypothetical protein NONO_c00660 [Nocardia nova SH22a]